MILILLVALLTQRMFSGWKKKTKEKDYNHNSVKLLVLYVVSSLWDEYIQEK